VKRPWQTWLLFGASIALIALVMLWGSITILRLDREAIESRRRAAIEEDVRLALWRLDSSVTPLIAREGSHSVEHFSSFARPTGKDLEGLEPSPLIDRPKLPVLLHFQIHPDQSITSPQAPEGRLRELALERNIVAKENLEESEQMLRTLGKWLELGLFEQLVSITKKAPQRPSESSFYSEPEPTPTQQRDEELVTKDVTTQQKRQRATMEQQQALNISELEARTANIVLQTRTQQATPRYVPRIEPSALLPVWAYSQLFLVRQIQSEGDTTFQGSWLDWPTLREDLLDSISDIFPDADLHPIGDGYDDTSGRRLASLPVYLNPGKVHAAIDNGHSPTQILVAVVWFFLVFAGISVAVLLHGSVVLSERRGAFVSSVTHELRTPLTSLRMYAEMLAENMIQDEATQKEYLGTLLQQSERLSHLVENVLAYSRLERGLGSGEHQLVLASTLLDRIIKPLADLASQSGMTLELEADPGIAQTEVRIDLSAVERILFNLVDNACKYGRTDHEPGVAITVDSCLRAVRIRVRDFGPGVSPEVKNRLFSAFSKSATEAAESAPGIGLGLAISRRLAREMGGELQLDSRVQLGATFVLTLPVYEDKSGSLKRYS
jgi:signal transduction histidine kinase